MADTQKGIQATLFDYFQDTEYFTLQEAEEHVLDHQKRDVNVPSIRARIYEGIEKGLFERVGKGLYTVTRTDEQGRENKCLLINGDGRDLSMFPDNSLDALITVAPIALPPVSKAATETSQIMTCSSIRSRTSTKSFVCSSLVTSLLSSFRRRTATTTNTCTVSKTSPARRALNTTPRCPGRIYRPVQAKCLHYSKFYELHI